MSKPLMPPLWWVDRFITRWGVSPPPIWTVTGEWFRGVLRLSTEVFQAILTELTINTQPNTKEADSFQSFVPKSQACITVECLSQVWIHQQWALGLGSWGNHLRHNLPASWRMRSIGQQSTHKVESFPCPQELVLVWREQAQSHQWEGWSQASVTGFPGTWTLRNEVVESELCLIY